MRGDTPRVAFVDLEPSADTFWGAVTAGLSATPKHLPRKFLYDEAGSRLFDQICELPEYYPTSTELSILKNRSAEIAWLARPRAHVIELGSGSGTKVRLLLDALDRPAAYTAIDISHEHMLAATEDLAVAYPTLAVSAVCADYTRPLAGLAGDPALSAGRHLVFFPGSTIGNLEPEAAVTLLRVAHDIAGPGGALLIGMDLVKDAGTLVRAYDDAAGVTAAFNLNLLTRINRELVGGFDIDRFAHQAVWNPQAARMELYLEILAEQTVPVGDTRFTFPAGERIHTENSHKYTIYGFQDLARRAGFADGTAWTDPNGLFSVHMLTRS